MAAAALHEVHCPQCGADTPVRDHIATACSGCGTLLVSLKGQVKRARGFSGHLPREEDTVALVCRLCGGALPDDVLKSGTGAKCTYCGERADIPPTILAMFRAMVTHPRAVPLAARRISQFWIGTAIAFAIITVIYMTLPPPDTQEEVEMKLANPELVKTEGDARYYRVNGRAGPFELKPRANLNPSLYLKFYDFNKSEGKIQHLIRNQEIFVLTTAVFENTGERRSRWLTMFDGAQFSRSTYLPTDRVYEAFYFQNTLVGSLPIGKYHVEVSEFILRGEGDPPPYVVCEWNSGYTEMNMWFIMSFNALAWILLLDVRRLSKKQLGDTKWIGITQWLTVTILVFLLIESVWPLDPFGNKGKFEADTAPAVPSVLMPKPQGS
jgi:DNA-directed RNA polymerase subunit RPC12/RpoP